MQRRDIENGPFNRKPEFSSLIPENANCAHVLELHKQEVIRAFESEARNKVPAAHDKEADVIVDSLSIYLDQLVLALSRGAKVEEAYEISRICEEHGKQRATLTNYTLEQVLYEYALLRRILLSTLRKHTEITNEESDVIHEAIQEGMIQAGSQFTRQHNQAREMLEKEKKALATRAERFHASLASLLASSPVGIAFVDCNLRFVQINKPLAALNGASIEAHIGREVREMLPKDAGFLEPILREVLESGQPKLNVELRAKNPKDPEKEVRLLANYFPVQISPGTLIGVGALVVDITDLTKAREALRESEELRTSIFESSEDCYKILDPKGKLLVLTDFSLKHLELEEAGPLIGKSWFGFWSRPEDSEAAKEAVRNAAAGERGHFVGYYPTPSGKRKWWDVVITPMRNAEGKIDRLLAVSRDVTQIRMADEALKARLAEVDIIIESIPEAVYIGDEHGIYQANKVALEQLGFDSLEEMNKKITELSKIVQNRDPETGRELSPTEVPFSKALRGERSVQVTEVIHLKTGERRLIRGAAAPILVDGKIKGAVAVNVDVTAAQRAQEALGEKNRELDRFAAIAAHDLKSPLNSITQFTQLLADQYRGRLDVEADQYIDFIISAGKRMSELIDNLLEFARSGALDKSKMAEVNAFDVVETVRKNLLSEIKRTNARITVNPDLPSVLGKKLQITQLFQNLLANAIKFHKPHRSPEIEIDFSDRGDCWCFSVTDHGIGMDLKYSQKIFEIFNRIPGGQQYEGSGIGLAVCKRIVEAHGGKIHFHSEPDKGATFYFTLPKFKAAGSLKSRD